MDGLLRIGNVVYDCLQLPFFPVKYTFFEKFVMIEYANVPGWRKVSKQRVENIINKRRDYMEKFDIKPSDLNDLKEMVASLVKSGFLPGTIKTDSGRTWWEIIEKWERKNKLISRKNKVRA